MQLHSSILFLYHLLLLYFVFDVDIYVHFFHKPHPLSCDSSTGQIKLQAGTESSEIVNFDPSNLGILQVNPKKMFVLLYIFIFNAFCPWNIWAHWLIRNFKIDFIKKIFYFLCCFSTEIYYIIQVNIVNLLLLYKILF